MTAVRHGARRGAWELDRQTRVSTCGPGGASKTSRHRGSGSLQPASSSWLGSIRTNGDLHG